MAYAMEGAARNHVPFFVLDRPNPINGVRVEGPMLDSELKSFLGYLPLPVRHGMTTGELAVLFNNENELHTELNVIRMRGWQRGDWFDSTSLRWVDPSPNIRSLQAALLYPAVALLEASPDYSVGRGTDAPFEQIGAPWIRGPELAAYLNARFIPGLRFYPTSFRPVSSASAGVQLEGVRFLLTDREAFSAQRLGLEIAAALLRLYPGKISLAACERLIGSVAAMNALKAGDNPVQIEQAEQDRVADFLPKREKSLLY
jgi:uncharacterized protein YbbC (DUF1343 family)